MNQSLVTFRIKSNASTHGIKFAADQEIARFIRAGFSRNASISMGLASVSAAIRA